MIFSAVFLIGLSTLAFEILLARVFSITQWNHLSFMVISIALFGFAASGTFFSILNSRRKEQPLQSTPIVQTATIWVSLFSAATLIAFMVVNNLPLDYFRLPLEPVQGLFLLAAFILLALPFFFSGGVVAQAYICMPENTGLIYFASMCGSACGAALPLWLLPVLSEGQLIVLVALIPLLVVPVYLIQWPPNRSAGTSPVWMRICGIAMSCFSVSVALFLMHPQGRPLIQVTPSPYKTLSQVQQFPETHIDQTVHAIRGRIDRVSSPYIRFAPGLSLRYQNSLIPQSAAFTDGDGRLVLYPPDNPASIGFAPYTLTYSGYALLPGAQSVLAVMQNGGSAMACVRASGIEDVTLVIENPVLGNMLSKHYEHTVISRPVRSFLTATDRHFDIIQLEQWDTSIPGSGALNQNHLFTQEAFMQYFNHLTAPGVIIVSRRLLLPPSDSLRLWSAAYEGLEKTGVDDPEKHLAVLRNWDTFVLLVFRQPLVNAALLKKFAVEHNFDLVFLVDLPASQANRFNQFDAPYHYNQLQNLAAAYRQKKEDDYFSAYLLDVRPQSDNRPFPGRYLKWTKVKTLYHTLGSRLYTLLLSGEIVVMVVFLEALAVSGMVLFLPLLFMRRHVLKPSLQQALFFIGIGAGFMFVELFFIKKLMLIWNDPVISFSVVVTGVLVFSSLGGIWAQKKKKSVLNGSLVFLIVALLMAFFTIDRLVNLALGWAPVWKYGLVLLALGPIGFLMGLPFTIGMRDVLFSDAQRAWAWSANGCASVLASIVAAQIALMLGIRFILGSAVVSYLLVMLSWQHLKRL